MNQNLLLLACVWWGLSGLVWSIILCSVERWQIQLFCARKAMPLSSCFQEGEEAETNCKFYQEGLNSGTPLEVIFPDFLKKNAWEITSWIQRTKTTRDDVHFWVHHCWLRFRNRGKGSPRGVFGKVPKSHGVLWECVPKCQSPSMRFGNGGKGSQMSQCFLWERVRTTHDSWTPDDTSTPWNKWMFSNQSKKDG